MKCVQDKDPNVYHKVKSCKKRVVLDVDQK